MKNKLIFAVLFGILFIGMRTTVFAQSHEAQKENTGESTQEFLDRFQWVNSQNNSIHEIHFSGGYSFHSTQGFWGKIPGAKLRVWGVRYNRKMFHFNNQHLIEYVTELNFSVDYNLTSSEKSFPPGSFSGFGATPLGFQINFDQQNLIQPFFKSSAGFMYFEESFPDDRGTSFNFTLELGGGVEFVVAQNISFTLGYKYHHMSNGQFGFINPGVDSNIFYSGITIF